MLEVLEYDKFEFVASNQPSDQSHNSNTTNPNSTNNTQAYNNTNTNVSAYHNHSRDAYNACNAYDSVNDENEGNIYDGTKWIQVAYISSLSRQGYFRFVSRDGQDSDGKSNGTSGSGRSGNRGGRRIDGQRVVRQMATRREEYIAYQPGQEPQEQHQSQPRPSQQYLPQNQPQQQFGVDWVHSDDEDEGSSGTVHGTQESTRESGNEMDMDMERSQGVAMERGGGGKVIMARVGEVEMVRGEGTLMRRSYMELDTNQQTATGFTDHGCVFTIDETDFYETGFYPFDNPEHNLLNNTEHNLVHTTRTNPQPINPSTKFYQDTGASFDNTEVQKNSCALDWRALCPEKVQEPLIWAQDCWHACARV